MYFDTAYTFGPFYFLSWFEALNRYDITKDWCTLHSLFYILILQVRQTSTPHPSGSVVVNKDVWRRGNALTREIVALSFVLHILYTIVCLLLVAFVAYLVVCLFVACSDTVVAIQSNYFDNVALCWLKVEKVCVRVRSHVRIIEHGELKSSCRI